MNKYMYQPQNNSVLHIYNIPVNVIKLKQVILMKSFEAMRGFYYSVFNYFLNIKNSILINGTKLF